jgi:hypothetical protein
MYFIVLVRARRSTCRVLIHAANAGQAVSGEFRPGPIGRVWRAPPLIPPLMLTTASGLRTRLQHIDAEICQLENSLQSLREARTGVLNELRSLIYPVLSLPFEITSQIFLHCLPKRLEDSIRPYPSLNEAPLVFTRVCRDWRTVAISTSTLWNHVRIELDSDDGLGHIDSKWVALLDLWLQRSQPQPLSLTLSNWSYTEPGEALLGVLDRQSRRWRNITFKLPFNYFSRFEEHASLPLLERLTLSAHGSPDIINPISAFRHAPILRHVCFEAGMHPSEIPRRVLYLLVTWSFSFDAGSRSTAVKQPGGRCSIPVEAVFKYHNEFSFIQPIPSH